MNRIDHDNYRIVIELYSGNNFMSAIHTHKDAERIFKDLEQQIKRHIDLPYGTSIYTEYDTFEYCEFCGHDVTDKTDVYSEIEFHEGELLAWPGMPVCCTEAQVRWARNNFPPAPLVMPDWMMDMLADIIDQERDS